MTTALPAHRDLTYEPIDTVHAGGHAQHTKAPRSADRCECPGCGVLRSPGAIVTHAQPNQTNPAEWSAKFGCWTLHRSFYCAGCEHVVHWTERATPDGHACGEVLIGPGQLSGAAYIRAYLTTFPQALEVDQI